MFGISAYKLIVIILVIIVLFKPKDLPKLLYYFGKFIRKIKLFINKIENEIDTIGALGDIDKYFSVEKKELDSIKQDITDYKKLSLYEDVIIKKNIKDSFK